MNTSGLRPHQVPHVANLCQALRTNSAVLDGSDTGTGKTYAACAVARELGVVPLVLCPLPVAHSWRTAAQQMGIEIDIINYERVRGVTRKLNHFNPRIFGPAFRKHTESEYGYVKQLGRGSRWIWKHEFELAIFDEVQRCAGETSILSKMLIAGRRQFKYLHCLSATAASEPAQLRALGYALGLFELKNFRWWLLGRGCKPGIFGGITFNEDPAKQLRAMEKIHHEIFPARGARLRKRDIPGFPETQIEVRLVDDVSGKAGRLAEDLREAYLNRTRQAEESEHHLTKDTRCRQALELLKVDVLVSIAEDYAKTSKVAIFVNYTETVDALERRLSKLFGAHNIGVIDGRNSATRAVVERDFQNNNLTAVVVNNAAGGVGLNLHDPSGKVDRTAEISPCYSADLVKQVLGRVHRDGGAFSQQFFVYFKDSREAQIADRLTNKLNNLDTLNDAELNGVF